MHYEYAFAEPGTMVNLVAEPVGLNENIQVDRKLCLHYT